MIHTSGVKVREAEVCDNRVQSRHGRGRGQSQGVRWVRPGWSGKVKGHQYRDGEAECKHHLESRQ